MRTPLTPNVPVEPEGAEETGNRTEGVPPTTRASRWTTMPVCGGVEAYNERSFCVKYCVHHGK